MEIDISSWGSTGIWRAILPLRYGSLEHIPHLGGRQVGLRGSSSCGGMFPCLGDHMILSQIGFLRGLRRKLVMVSWHLLSSNLGIVESTLGCNT
jgi:hypothetical protein